MTRQHILDAAGQVPPFGPVALHAAGGASCIIYIRRLIYIYIFPAGTFLRLRRLPWTTNRCGRVGYVVSLVSPQRVPVVENLFTKRSSASVRRAHFEVYLARWPGFCMGCRPAKTNARNRRSRGSIGIRPR